MLILNSQTFSDEELINFACGHSSIHGPLVNKLLHWDFGPLMEMHLDVNAKNYLFSKEAVPFHWDGAFYREPKKLLFYCTESEGAGGETLFVNTEKIWESFSELEKEMCQRVILTYETKKVAHYGGKIEIPLVQRHPTTGKSILRMAERVETELNPVELQILGVQNAHEFYEFMREKLYHKDFLYEHTWQKGDLIICDNFTYLHGRRPLGQNRKRRFKRIQIL